MLVPVSGIRVSFAPCQQWVAAVLAEPDGLLRTVLDAGETEIAVSLRRNPVRGQLVVPARTDIRTGPAADTGIRNGKIPFAPFEEPDLGIEPRECHEPGVHLPFLFAHGFQPVPPSGYFPGDAPQVFRDTLVHLHLLVHVEIRQPVIHHDERGDVVEGVSCLGRQVVPYLRRIAFPCSVPEYYPFVSREEKMGVNIKYSAI